MRTLKAAGSPPARRAGGQSGQGLLTTQGRHLSEPPLGVSSWGRGNASANGPGTQKMTTEAQPRAPRVASGAQGAGSKWNGFQEKGPKVPKFYATMHPSA